MNMITQLRLTELLSYDGDTGLFFWKKGRGKAGAGAKAGVINARGYVQIGIDKKVHLAHRLAWIYYYGSKPSMHIDHINRIKTDNRISNLRDVSPSQNSQNTVASCRSRSGIKGVSWDKKRKKWSASIVYLGKSYALGRFHNMQDAVNAYVFGAMKYHTTNPVVDDALRVVGVIE